MGLLLGLIFNLAGIEIFSTFNSTFDLISAGTISVALFSLGGSIVKYNLSKNFRKISLIIIASLFMHPLITFAIGHFGFNLSTEILRGAIITSAMGPGINAFIFSSIYEQEKEVVAGAVLICTPLSIFGTLLWIAIL